ncbi:MAG: hypothetical protein M3R06_08340 [Chloroflexota bacterium]|nr:hypothetical protein [Chloroflexota bacterium]
MPVDLQIGAKPANDQPGKRVGAPGAMTSPQLPGQVPDRSTIPGQFTTRLTKPATVERPLSEDGTTQRIMGVYAAEAGHADDPARFEQATASYEELRKAYPAQLPAQRPAPGHALATGNASASERQEIGGVTPSPALPASQTAANEPAASEVPLPAHTSAPPSDQSHGAAASASPGDLTSPGGTLLAAKQGQRDATSDATPRIPGSPGEATQ